MLQWPSQNVNLKKAGHNQVPAHLDELEQHCIEALDYSRAMRDADKALRKMITAASFFSQVDVRAIESGGVFIFLHTS